MMRYCERKSPWRLAEEIESVIPKAAGERMARRPFNHYVPVNTDWWIVPSSEQPFFRYGTYYFSWDPEARDVIRCGFHVTKGLAPELKAVYTSKKGRRLLMNDSWAWYRFREALADGSLRAMAEQASRASGGPLEIHFYGGYVEDAGLADPDQELQKRDRYRFVFDPAAGTVSIAGAKRDAMCLKCLNAIRNWDSLVQAVGVLDREAFLWCDVFLAIPYGVREYGEFAPDETVSGAEAIYRDTLEPFRPLVR